MNSSEISVRRLREAGLFRCLFESLEGGIPVAGESGRNAGAAVSIKTRVKLYKTYFKNSL